MSDSSSGGIAKFVLGIAVGVALTYGYVRWGVELPAALQMPGTVRDNVVSTAAEETLYDLDQPADARERALEVMLRSRPRFVVQIDRDAGQPLLAALYRARAAREARQLRAAWSAFDDTLAKPALRQALERRHATEDADRLKQAMLAAQLKRSKFLARYMELHPEQRTGALGSAALLSRLEALSRLPAMPTPSAIPAPTVPAAR